MGLPDYLEIRRPGEKGLLESLLEDGDRSWSIEDVARIVRDVNRPLFVPRPPTMAKQRIRHSDTNFQLLKVLRSSPR